jgi:CRISPR-associated endonuclease Cas2
MMAKPVQRTLIAYDLRERSGNEREYGGLYLALESLGGARIQESVWVVRTAESVNAISLKLQGYIYPDDRLLVTRIGEFTSHKGINKIRPV